MNNRRMPRFVEGIHRYVWVKHKINVVKLQVINLSNITIKTEDLSKLIVDTGDNDII